MGWTDLVRPLQTLCFWLCIQRRQVDAAIFDAAGCPPLKNEMPPVRQQSWNSVVHLLARVIDGRQPRGYAAPSGNLKNASCAAENDFVIAGPEASKDKDRTSHKVCGGPRNIIFLSLPPVQNTM